MTAEAVFSAIFDEVRTDNSVTREGARWLNISDGRAYIYWHGAAVGYTPSQAQIVVVSGVGLFGVVGTRWAQVYDIPDHAFATLAEADVTATAIGATLTISKHWSLASHTTLSAPAIRMDGGSINLGDCDLTFHANPLLADAKLIFVQAGSGRVKGAPAVDAVMPEWWGAKGDGITDDLAAFDQAAVHAAGKIPVKLSARTYYVSRGVTVPAAGLTLIGMDREKSIMKIAPAEYAIRGSDIGGLNVSDVGFLGKDGNDIAFGLYGRSTGIRIRRCKTTNAGLWHSVSSGANYAASNDANSPSDILIEDCTGIGNASHVVGQPFISFAFGHDFRVNRCVASNYVHGIQWWGGDSDPNKDGALSNVRKISDVEISQCKMTDMAGGGIWGSMGRRIKVIEPDVRLCGDVGVDFEGCQESGCEGGHVQDCKNGCLTTFWYNRGVYFRNVDVTLHSRYLVASRIYNASLDNNESVTFDGGTWISLGGIGSADLNNGPATQLVFSKLKLQDIVMPLSSAGNHVIRVEDVDMRFTRPLGGNAKALAVAVFGRAFPGGGRAGLGIVKNVKVTSLVAQAGKHAIEVYTTDGNYADRFEVTGCETSGFPTDLLVEWDGANAGVKGTFLVQGNKFGSRTIDSRGLNGARLITSNNYGLDGTAIR